MNTHETVAHTLLGLALGLLRMQRQDGVMLTIGDVTVVIAEAEKGQKVRAWYQENAQSRIVEPTPN